MAESTEELQKQLAEGVDSVYPNMDLKRVGDGTNRQRSRESSFDGTPAIIEEASDSIRNDCGENEEDDEDSLKAKFKHVNLLTDSGEFNSTSSSSSVKVGAHIKRCGSSATTGQQQLEETPIEEEDDNRAEDEEEKKSNAPLKKAALKLTVATQLVENSLIVDKGEFECNSPSKMNLSGLKKLGSSSGSAQTSMFASQISSEVEALAEEPEKEEEDKEDIKNTKPNSSTCLKHNHQVDIPRVDDLHQVGTNPVKHTCCASSTELEDVQPIAEEEENIKDDETANDALKEAKQEREHEKQFIKKILDGDKFKETDKVGHMADPSESVAEIKETAAIAEDDEQ